MPAANKTSLRLAACMSSAAPAPRLHTWPLLRRELLPQAELDRLPLEARLAANLQLERMATAVVASSSPASPIRSRSMRGMASPRVRAAECGPRVFGSVVGPNSSLIPGGVHPSAEGYLLYGRCLREELAAFPRL